MLVQNSAQLSCDRPKIQEILFNQKTVILTSTISYKLSSAADNDLQSIVKHNDSPTKIPWELMRYLFGTVTNVWWKFQQFIKTKSKNIFVILQETEVLMLLCIDMKTIIIWYHPLEKKCKLQ